MDILAPGKYQASPLEWGEGTGKNDYKYLWVEFQPDLSKRPVRWFGGLNTANGDGSPNTKFDHTVKALELMGLDYAKAGDFGLGSAGAAIDKQSVVEIVVKHSERDGRLSASVAWVNDPKTATANAGTTGLLAAQLAKKKAMAGTPTAKPVDPGQIPF